MTTPPVEPCPLCGGPRITSADAVSGYVEGTFYRTQRCTQCDACCADPLRADAEVYDAIYAQPERVAGYARYAHYAEAILGQRDPLAYLCTREPCYWALVQGLRGISSDLDIDILEVGCGLGYLTYALTHAGYQKTVGVDLSATAVARARQRYGCDYRVADIDTMAEAETERFDAVILSEVIEHLEDPVAFVGQLRRLLKPGGKIVLTTPNRSFGGNPQQPWATDPPPVHLWWLTERSLASVADQLSLDIAFVDFSAFNRRHFRQFWKAWQHSHVPQSPQPLLNAAHQPCLPVPRPARHGQGGLRGALRRISRELGARMHRLGAARGLDLRHSPWIGAILENR